MSYTHEEILNILNKSNGKIFSIEYTTKEGEYRNHTAKLYTHKSFTKGHASKAMTSTAEAIPDLFGFVDALTGKWKRVYLDNIISAKVNGVCYTFKQEVKTA